MSVKKQHLNLQDAEQFLDLLEPNGHFTFQSIGERSDAKSHRPVVLHGRWHDQKERLAELNTDGHGIFVTVNKTDGRGRKAENIQRVRANFLDLDNAPLQPVLTSEALPHIVVETSPGRWHVYWLIEDCPLQDFKSRQQMLAHRFNGDLAVSDLPRLMRLPGFLHQKNEDPFLARLVPQSEWEKLAKEAS